jgi:hypothetical protein
LAEVLRSQHRPSHGSHTKLEFQLEAIMAVRNGAIVEAALGAAGTSPVDGQAVNQRFVDDVD